MKMDMRAGGFLCRLSVDAECVVSCLNFTSTLRRLFSRLWMNVVSVSWLIILSSWYGYIF